LQKYVLSSVADADPVGSGLFCQIRIWTFSVGSESGRIRTGSGRIRTFFIESGSGQIRTFLVGSGSGWIMTFLVGSRSGRIRSGRIWIMSDQVRSGRIRTFLIGSGPCQIRTFLVRSGPYWLDPDLDVWDRIRGMWKQPFQIITYGRGTKVPGSDTRYFYLRDLIIVNISANFCHLTFLPKRMKPISEKELQGAASRWRLTLVLRS
jgi:hypothetical protein